METLVRPDRLKVKYLIVKCSENCLCSTPPTNCCGLLPCCVEPYPPTATDRKRGVQWPYSYPRNHSVKSRSKAGNSLIKYCIPFLHKRHSSICSAFSIYSCFTANFGKNLLCLRTVSHTSSINQSNNQSIDQLINYIE